MKKQSPASELPSLMEILTQSKDVKNLIYLLYRKFENIIKYCMIGCIGAGLDFIIYTILVSYYPEYYQMINVFSTSVGIVNNFLFNAFLNFKVRNRMLLRFFSFYCVGAIGILIAAGLLYLFVECMSVHPVIAKLITIFVITLVQFSLNKYVTFRQKETCVES